jgi:hypothetical protein
METRLEGIDQVNEEVLQGQESNALQTTLESAALCELVHIVMMAVSHFWSFSLYGIPHASGPVEQIHDVQYRNKSRSILFSLLNVLVPF